jgi:hypothetical protein
MASRLTDFLRRLVAPKSGRATAAGGDAVDYQGYAIRPASRREGPQWLTAGVITKEFADGVKEHHFIRAERHASRENADAFAVIKAKQIIDERGDKLFREG